MSTQTDTTNCTLTCWVVAALAGLAAAAILLVVSGWGWMQALFVAAVVFCVLGLVLSLFICPAGTAKADLEAVRKGTKGAAAATGVTRDAAPSAPAPTPPATPNAPAPSAEPAPVVSAGAPGPATATTAPAPSASSTPAPDATEAKPKRPAVAADGQPELMEAPRASGADDLKLISGVGPKLEQTLNEMGIWHFEQVAGWRKKEIEWVDARLKFKGRIERDDWMSQAKILAKGGETEFSRKKKK